MHAEAQSAISWLRTFKIEISSTSNRLYRNGHQQIEVSLIVEPISGKTITDKQLDSLAIVSEEDDGTYKLLPEFVENPKNLNKVADPEPWFYKTERDENYEYFPSNLVANQTHELTRKTTQTYTKRRYIHSTATSGSTITLRGRIQEESENPETIYYTDKGNKFDSKVDLVTVAIPLYTFPEDYTWTKFQVEGNPAAGGRFVLEYLLHPIDTKFVSAEFSCSDVKGMIRWQDHQPTQTFASHVGIATPGCAKVKYNDKINLGDTFPPHKVIDVKNFPNGAITLLGGLKEQVQHLM